MNPSARTRRKLAELHPDLRARVEAFITAAPMPIGITSGYRSRERQAQLYADYKAGRGNPANPPGTSKHEREIDGKPAAEAADLDWPDDPDKRAAAVHWGHRHCAEFGLHFPIRREDWHVESNGRPFTPAAPEELDMDEKTLRRIVGEEIDRRVTVLLRGEQDGKSTGHADHLKAIHATIKAGFASLKGSR